MLTLYLASFVVGGVLVLVSTLWGGHEHGLGHELGPADGHDVAAADTAADGEGAGHHGFDHEGVHGASGPWFVFLSLRFWTFFWAFFGLTGLIFDGLALTSRWVTLGLSLVVGAVSGSGVAGLIRWATRHQVDSSVTVGDLEGASARVLLPIGRHEEGRIRIYLKGYVNDMRARTDDEHPLAIGAEALVVRVSHGLATVTAMVHRSKDPSATSTPAASVTTSAVGEDARTDARTQS